MSLFMHYSEALHATTTTPTTPWSTNDGASTFTSETIRWYITFNDQFFPLVLLLLFLTFNELP